MITENEVSEILRNELPELNSELDKLPGSNNIYKTMQCFVDFTKELVSKRNLEAVKNCFTLAERMSVEGNYTVKNAIENVYVFSISTILDLSNSLGKEINAMFNGSLRKEYIRQISTSSI